MTGVFTSRAGVLLVAGVTLVGALTLVPVLFPPAAAAPMSFWEAAGRGLLTVTMVNETVHENGRDVTLPAGILVTNVGGSPVAITEYPILMSPAPWQSPQPAALATTQDAVLTNGTVPAGGSLLYSYGELVLAGELSEPAWWCMEEMQFTKADAAFAIGGETLPFALRGMLEHPFYTDRGNNTQTALWASLRESPGVVVGKQPLWTELNDTAGQRLRVRIDATNLAIWSTDDGVTADVNVTQGGIEDEVPAGWTVEEGSYSVAPDQVVNHSDGSKTIVWYADLPAAAVNAQGNPAYPTGYMTRTRSYTLVTPSLPVGTVTLPRARSDMDRSGEADAQSAPVTLTVTSANPSPVANAGGPYVGKEGDTIVLNASSSSDPNGDPLQFRWSFRDNGTWDTAWSSSPLASAKYVDEFKGHARVEVSDGHTTASAVADVTIMNVPPTISDLRATAEADFTLFVAGEKWHDVTLTLRYNGSESAAFRVLREPGSPSSQSRSTGRLAMNLSSGITATAAYTPADDRVNGQPNGDSPAWLVIAFPDGGAVRLFHNFNTQHESTWTWSIPDLRAHLVREGVTLQAHLRDPGADSLTAHWDFGDGTNVTQAFANGPEPVAPFEVTALITHGYASEGTYIVTLTVDDGDRGVATASVAITFD